MLILVLSLFGVVMGCNVRPIDTRCDEGWTYIQRELYGWCVKIMNISDCFGQGGSYSLIENLEELEVYVNLIKISGEKYARTLERRTTSNLCPCLLLLLCPITETCKPPSAWSQYNTSIEVLEKVEPYYLNENKTGAHLFLTTENESGLTDNQLGVLYGIALCGKNATSIN
ncbi:unnamed protein product [Caenorhabditis angaria]|uniref:Uncharacterized protein n=1 Tax=Caenorhabditis angaria TaxID=860376 RepID=A0A9P1N235_9PELO|nr:unnamed protein product [Caenorhabditis angaria]